ncbi:hypothetical protein P7K49_012170 [Saguinus oedipus]|uniref:Uncharacterized protein n=1 Tax=Saguinus oedipus TaxID=9490 RepID=A0ABQ9VSQ4_SAGOE|nr:hypothetical protein P7K49_012170 [Saguinus oedipus]
MCSAEPMTGIQEGGRGMQARCLRSQARQGWRIRGERRRALGVPSWKGTWCLKTKTPAQRRREKQFLSTHFQSVYSVKTAAGLPVAHTQQKHKALLEEPLSMWPPRRERSEDVGHAPTAGSEWAAAGGVNTDEAAWTRRLGRDQV